jgi:hypothetical protein
MNRQLDALVTDNQTASQPAIGRYADRQMDGDATHYHRTLSSALREAMLDTPVVCLLGPRPFGKTTLAMSLEPDRTYITLDEDGYFRTATEDPDGFVARLPARVILDEVQRVPALLTAIKRSVDRDRRPGSLRIFHRTFRTGWSGVVIRSRSPGRRSGRGNGTDSI